MKRLLPSRWPIFWSAFLVVALVRVLVAMSRSDEFRGEELYIGSFAWALLEGMPLDASQLPIIVHLRGSVLFSVLTVPLFAVLGPSYVGLKCLAVGWGAACGGLFAVLLRRRLGVGAAWIGALLYAFLPPSFQFVDVMALGSHGDTLLFILAALLALLWSDEPLGFRRALAFGAACGMGVLFSWQFAVVLPALFLTWLALDRRFFRRRSALAAAAAAVVCVVPIPFLSGAAGTLVQKPMSEHVLPDGIGGSISKLLGTLGHELRRSWLFEASGGAWLGWVYLAALVAGLVLLVPRLRRLEPLAVFCAAYPALMIGAYAISGFRLNFLTTSTGMGSRYFMPMLPFLAAWIPLGAEPLRRRAGTLAVGALAGLPIGAGLLGVLAQLELARPWRRPPLRGTNFAFFAVHVNHAAGESMRERLEWVRRVEPDWDVWRPLAYQNIHPPESVLGAGPPGLEDVRRVAALAPELRPYALAALGTRLGASPEREHVYAVLTALAAEPELAADPTWLPWFARGVGTGTIEIGLGIWVRSQGEKPMVYAELSRMPAPARELVAEGAGFRMGQIVTPYNDGQIALIAEAGRLPPELLEAFCRGLGRGYRLRFREATYRVPDVGHSGVDEAVPAAGRSAFRTGLTVP